MTIAIGIIVAIAVVIVSFGFIIPGIAIAHIISDGEHPPTENVSDYMLRLKLQKTNIVCINVIGS